jgi:hypothetical protein
VIPLLGLVFPFVKAFLGDGLVEKVLAHKRAQAASANEEKRMYLEADIKIIEAESKRREQIAALQAKEYEHPLLWWGKFLLTFNVGMYWACRFFVKWTGLTDFNVAIAELSEPEVVVSGMVLTYWFLANKVERVFTNLAGKK